MRLAFLTLILWVTSAASAESDWRTGWDGTLYGYANSSAWRNDSVLNPANQIARQPQRNTVGELRLNARAENDTVRLTLRAIAGQRATANGFGQQESGESYLSQWQLRVRATEDWHLAAGRDVLNWGAGQFRSPSSPFYFDNGRSDPMRELIGVDSLKLTWTPDMQRSISLVRIVDSGHGAPQPDVWRDSWLAKIDSRADAWAGGLVAAKAPNMSAFYAAHGQATLSDALLLYGEISSSTRPQALQSPADTAQAFSVQAASPRRTTALLGGTYTFEDGKSLTAEYLHDGHGYSTAQESAYFRRAVTQPGMALGLAPRLLGRDYLHLVWQSNLMEEGGYWRLMYTHSLTDGGNELAAYGETGLGSKTSVYVLAVVPQGDARQEFSALLRRSITLGLKIAVP